MTPRTSSTVPEISHDARWARVLSRDARADFVFAVRTTGIYCRPSCPARRPRPENARFFDTTAAARAAGFRACLRCRPDERTGDADAALVRRVSSRLEQVEPPALPVLAREEKLSVATLTRVFERTMGLTPRAYVAAKRAERTERALRAAPSVSAAMYDAGYRSRARFHVDADARLGMSPTAYRAGGAGLEIRYAVGRCALGHVLVGTTERGVCAILLGDRPAALTRELATRFSRATRIDATAALARELAEVVRLVAEPARATSLPLDVRGTAFQARVWRALREIPPGQTRSYAEIARSIGAPTSARAVGRACAENPVAIAVPCHRAVAASGELNGYRWGLHRKHALLSEEDVTVSDRLGRRRSRSAGAPSPSRSPAPPAR